MKRGYIRGVLTCDPSWTGLAFTIHVPSLQYNSSVVMDLTTIHEKKQSITNPLTYIPLVVRAISILYKKRPYIRFCDKLIIESQFTESMKQLNYVIITSVLSKSPYMTVEYLSALTCKRKNNVSYGEGWYQNKKNALEYVTANKDKLIAGDTVLDHNTADSILILNTWLNLKKRHLYTNREDYLFDMATEQHFEVPFELKHTKWECPICKYHTGKMYLCKKLSEKSTQDRRGHFFIRCTAFEDDKARKCGALTWLGKSLPVISKTGTIGNTTIGIWTKGNGSNMPPREEQAQGYDCINTIPVVALGNKRKREDDIGDDPANKISKDNALEDIVSVLSSKQEALQKQLFDSQLKQGEMMAKLYEGLMKLSKEDPKKPEPVKPIVVDWNELSDE